jgi:hypothetical protein
MRTPKNSFNGISKNFSFIGITLLSYVLLSACEMSDRDRCFEHGGVYIDGFCNCDVNADDTFCKTRLPDLFKNTAVENDFILLDYIGTDKGIRVDTQIAEDYSIFFGSWFELPSKENLPNVDIHNGEYALHVKATDLGLIISVPHYPKYIEDEWQFFECKFGKLEGLEPIIEIAISQYAFRGYCEEDNIETIYWTTRSLSVVAFEIIRPAISGKKEKVTYLNVAAISPHGILHRTQELTDYAPRDK